MYDYIKVTASKLKATIVFAYSEPQDGVRQVTYTYVPEYNHTVKTSFLVTGESKTEDVTVQEFSYVLGTAVGEISNSVPGTERK